MAIIYFLIWGITVLFVLRKIFPKIELKIESESKLTYHKRDYLLSNAEKKFYDVLKIIADENNWIISLKVRLEDLIEVPHNMDYRQRWSLRGRIKSRHIDFVICDKINIIPLLAIELDDSSHGRWDRVESDNNLNRILKEAGLPLLRIRAKYSYSLSEILDQIREKITTKS